MRGSRGLFFLVNQFSNKLWGDIIHKLEPKEHRAIQSSESPQLTNSNQYYSNLPSEFKFLYTPPVPHWWLYISRIQQSCLWDIHLVNFLGYLQGGVVWFHGFNGWEEDLCLWGRSTTPQEQIRRCKYPDHEACCVLSTLASSEQLSTEHQYCRWRRAHLVSLRTLMCSINTSPSQDQEP